MPNKTVLKLLKRGILDPAACPNMASPMRYLSISIM